MCKRKKTSEARTIETLISGYFQADDYTNDNLPDILYWCVKGIVLLYILKRPITKGYKTNDDAEFVAYNELLRLSLDAVHLRLRLATSTTEKYSGGKFLKELKDFPNLQVSLEATYGQFIKQENKKTIGKLCKTIPSVYNHLYGYKKGASCPEFMHEYEREKFHQDKHSDGAKYKIMGYNKARFGRNTVKRRDKPTINFPKIYDSLEQISGIILSFCDICEFGCGNILCNCNRYHDDLDIIMSHTVSIYKYDFREDFLSEIKVILKDNLPLTLRLISRDVTLSQ